MSFFRSRVGRANELRVTRRRVKRSPREHLSAPAFAKSLPVEVRAGRARAEDESNVPRRADRETSGACFFQRSDFIVNRKPLLRLDANAESRERLCVERAQRARRKVRV